MAEYLNTKHQFAYIIYNFSDKSPLQAEQFHQVMDYPFPTATAPKTTVPPSLDAIFLVAVEMQ